MAEKQKPYAISKLVRGEDGTVHTVYVDAKTGKQLNDLNGYEILDDQNYLDPNTLKSELGEPKETEVTKNPLDEKKATAPKEPTRTAKKLSGGDTKDSRNEDRTGFNAYGPEGKDITDTKLGKIGVGLMGGMGGKLAGATLGGVVGGPIGALAGGLIGGVVGKKTFSGTSPYAKKQKEEAKKKEKEVPKSTGILSKAKSFVDSIFDGTVSEESLSQPAVGVATAETAANTKVGSTGLGELVGKSKAGMVNPNDSLGRQPLSKVDFDNIGLHPDFAAKAKDFQKEALDLGLDLSVDVANTRRSAEEQQAIAAAGFSKTNLGYHNTGFAVDISPTQINDEGMITDQKTLSASRALAEKHGFGLLNPSWDPAHMQVNAPGLTARSLYGMERDAFGNVKLSPDQSLNVRGNSVPTPTARPDPTNLDVSPFTKQDTIATGSTFDNIGPKSQEALADSKQQREDRFAGVSLKDASPATFAGLGLTSRSPAQISAMAQTIAGELGPGTLAALAANDPVAQQELAGMVASMENRANSKKFGTLETALAPSQYNSLMSKNLTTTEQNYSKYGQVIEKNIGDFLAGTLKPTDPNTTSYYNPDIANPSWGSKMNNPMNIGEHKFGVLDGPYDYSPSAAFKAERERLSTAQISDTRGFTPSRDYSGPGLSGNQNSPSEGAGKFGGSGLGSPSKGYSGKGGYDSPSEGGGKFGGSGLGSGGVKTDKSSYGGGPVDKSEKGWGGGSSKSSSSKSSSGGLGKNSDGSDNGWGGRSGSV